MKMLQKAMRVVIVVTAVVALGSCTWVLSFLNHFESGGTTYVLDEMTLEYYGSSPDNASQYYWLVLTGEGAGYGLNGFTGSGNILVFDLQTPSRELAEGEYDWGQTTASFVVYDAFALTNASTDSSGSIATADLTVQADGGQVWIRQGIDGSYVVEYDLAAYNFEVPQQRLGITGRYRGYIDYEYDTTVLANMANRLEAMGLGRSR